jgi:hypothetical protein
VHQRWLTILGLNVIIVLNVVGLLGAVANLAVIPFRNNLVRGVLFLIPPLTFYYLWKDWRRYENGISRVVFPVIVLVLVGFACAFLPSLKRDSRLQATLGGRVGRAVKSAEETVVEKTPEVLDKAKTLKEELPERFESTKEKLGDLGEKVKEEFDRSKEETAPSQDAAGQREGGDTDKPAPK